MRECRDCREEDDYLAFHRFPSKERNCGECIANKVLASLRERVNEQGGGSRDEQTS